MGPIKLRIDLKGAAQLLDRFIVTPRYHVGAAELGTDDRRDWIELHGAPRFCDCTVYLPGHQKRNPGIPLVSCRVIRIQLNRALKFFRRLGELEIQTEDETQGGVRFGECIVKLQRSLRSSLRPR